jgi:hypothetical protein
MIALLQLCTKVKKFWKMACIWSFVLGMKQGLPTEIVDVYDQISLYSFKTLINRHYKDLEENTSTT